SVCDLPIGQTGLQQMWISLRVATDVLPLLVNACSSACVAALPSGARGYIPTPHTGGRVDQPPSEWD
ncbi:leucine-rich repeat domain-containing protein, partial [Streptomyces prasinus]